MKTYALPLVLLLFFGCQSDKSYEPEKNLELLENQSEAPPQAAKAKKVAVEEKVNVTPRRIIKNADYRIQVGDVDASTERIIKMTEYVEGFVAQMNLVNTNWEITNHLTLRVPAEKFEGFLNAIGKEAVHTAHRRVTSQDVTAEFVDLQSRLKTKKEVKDRYETILRKQTKTVEEVLNAEEKIRRLQEEIEAAEGRLRLLSNQTGLSTVKLEIYQPKEYEHQPVSYTESFWLKLWEGFENGWSGVTSVILIFVNMWPVVFAAIFIWWRRRKIFGRFYRKENT